MAFDAFYRHPRMDFFSSLRICVAVDALRLHGFLRLSFIASPISDVPLSLYVTRRGGFFLKNYVCVYTWGYVYMSSVAHWGWIP